MPLGSNFAVENKKKKGVAVKTTASILLLSLCICGLQHLQQFFLKRGGTHFRPRVQLWGHGFKQFYFVTLIIGITSRNTTFRSSNAQGLPVFRLNRAFFNVNFGSISRNLQSQGLGKTFRAPIALVSYNFMYFSCLLLFYPLCSFFLFFLFSLQGTFSVFFFFHCGPEFHRNCKQLVQWEPKIARCRNWSEVID